MRFSDWSSDVCSSDLAHVSFISKVHSRACVPPEPGAVADAPVVAITGATGFIGRHLVRALAAAGWQVRILIRRDPAGMDWRDLQIQAVTGDLRDAGARRQLLAGRSEEHTSELQSLMRNS